MANEIYHRSNWGNAVNDNAWGDVYEKFDATNEMFVRSDNYENSNETDKLMAAINPKPSILLTPTAYDNGSLHSVKPVLYSNIIPNSNDASNWTVANNASIVNENGNLKLTDNVGSYGYASIAVNVELGKKYEITYNLVDVGTSTSNFVRIGSTPNATNYYAENNFTNTGKRTLTINPNQTTIYITIISGIGVGKYAYWNDITVRETADFDFSRGSSATRVNEQGLIEDVQILSSNLVTNGDFSQIGSELVTNGGFDADSDWGTEGTPSFSITNGILNCFSDGAYAGVSQNIVLEQGKTYKLEFDVVRIGENSGSLNFGDQTSFILLSFVSSIDDLGKKTIYFKPERTTTIIRIYRSTACDIDLDNVSVKEVGQNWTFGTGWSMGDGKAVRTGTTSSGLTQSGSFNNNKKYKLEFTISDYVGGSIKGDFYGGGGSDVFFTSNNIGNGTFSFITETTINRNTFQFYAFNSFSGSIDNVSLIEITDDTNLPRIDYTDGTGSLLLEPQSTNLITYSEDFSQWSSIDVTLESGYLAPNGSNNAYKVTKTGTNAFVYLSGSASDNARTIYAKTVSGSGDVKLTSHNSNTNNLFTVTENWQRFEVNSASSASGNFYAIDFRGAGTNLDEVIIWGAQTEALSYATSYIPTNGEVNGVTRLADVCNNAGSSDLINSTEGVLYAEVSALANDGTIRRITLNDETVSQQVLLTLPSTSNRIQVEVINSSNQFFQNFDVSNLLDFNKIAIKYKENDFSLHVNGIKVGTDTSGNVATGLSKLSFQRSDGSSAFYGKVKSVAVFKEALTDAQLTALTT